MLRINIKEAAKQLAQESVIVTPSESVYGFCAHPWSARALNEILDRKQRAPDMGFILVVADPQQFEPYVRPQIYTAWGQLLAQRPEDNISVILPLAKQPYQPNTTQQAQSKQASSQSAQDLSCADSSGPKTAAPARIQSPTSEQSQRLVYRPKNSASAFHQAHTTHQSGPAQPKSAGSATSHAVAPQVFQDPQKLSVLVSGGRITCAVRVTQHPVLKALCEACGHPLVSTSANTHGLGPYHNLIALEQDLAVQGLPLVEGMLGDSVKPSQIYDMTQDQWIRR